MKKDCAYVLVANKNNTSTKPGNFVKFSIEDEDNMADYTPNIEEAAKFITEQEARSARGINGDIEDVLEIIDL